MNLDTASPGPGDAWFAQYGWTPFAFQREVWAALGVPLTPAEPRSGPVVAPAPPLGVLWLTPMRALAADTARALQAPDWDLIAQPDPGFACDQHLSRQPPPPPLSRLPAGPRTLVPKLADARSCTPARSASPLWVELDQVSRFNNKRSTYRMVEKTRRLRNAASARN